MKKTSKRILSWLLALSMVAGMTCTVAFAEEPPAMPGGDMPAGDMGGMPGGEGGGMPGGPGMMGPTGSTVVVDRIITSSEDNLSSFAGGGWTAEDDDYAHVSALFINNGEIDERSVTEAITAGTYTATEAKDVVINSTYEGFNPIIVNNSKYTIDGAKITIDSDGDGLVANDFSGYGAAIAAYGDDTVLTIKNSDIWVGGVANLTLFADNSSDVIIENTKLHSNGGTLHAGYMNGPNQATMVAPPWILGIMGTSRTTNLEGNNTSTTVIDSDVSAAQWAVLSTDSGSNMQLNVVNTTMSLTGADYPLQADGTYTTAYGVNGADANPYTDKSGYGTYTIGAADERFYGVTQNVGTYANIYTGGDGLYTAMKAGQAIDLLDANDNVLKTYVPAEDRITVINSDTFGFMIHQGTNTLVIEEGTEVNSGYTTFLYKSGCSMDADITSGSVLNPGNGIILQAMDNDDATTGMDVATFTFYTEHVENAGWPTESFNLGSNAGDFTFTDVTMVGDIFNGSGWALNANTTNMGSPLESVALNIVLDGKTTLEGQISSTATIHVTKEGSDAIAAAPAGQKASENWLQYQLTSFPIGEYWNIGQVANMVKSSGSNPVNVTVADEAVWTVTADGIVNNVTASSKAIVADKPVTLTVEGTLTLDGKVVTGTTTVGNVTYVVKAAAPVGVSTTYTVVGGDSLWKIAQKFFGTGSKWGVIFEANKDTIKKSNLIYVGQTLIIPGEGEAPAAGGDMGGMPGGDMGMGGPGGPGMGGGASASVAPAGKLVVSLDADGVVTGVELLDIATKGSFGTVAAAPRYASVQNENVDGQTLTDDVSFHNGVIYDKAGEWTISNTTITMDTDADGSDTNDFSGLGAAVMTNGENVITKILNSKIETTGVAKLALFTDNGSITIVDDSEMYANAGVIYDGYMSTADQNMMISPPWVLGLGGNAAEPCNTRTTNLMGDYSVAAYVDSYFYAKGWGALSVDSGSNMNMVVVNSDVDVETSGYGAYNIGNSTEDYYGSTMDVSTYAIIMTGGEASFQSYTEGQEIDVVKFDGETNEYGHGINGNIVATVASDKVVGTRNSSIVSDNFGFMCHNNGASGWNIVDILDGTSVTTQDAVFLVKKVSAIFNVDNATLVSEDKGVILQIIDNDDDYVGLDFAATWGFDDEYGHTFGSHMPTFNSKFTEAAGYSNEWIADTAAAKSGDTSGNWIVEYNMTNSSVEGDIWNSTGYVGSNPATTLTVNLGEGAVLTGLISAGAFSHDVKEATVGNGDWTGAEALGHVTNIVNSNGVNLVHVNLTGDAVWNVTEDCSISSLTVAPTAKVNVAPGVTLLVDGAAYAG